MIIAVLLLCACTPSVDRGKSDNINNVSFSPDGKKIIFDRKNSEEPARINVYDLETGELSAYQPPKGESWAQARYSIDGNKIVFIIIPQKEESDDILNSQIAVMAPDGKNLKIITNSPGIRDRPSFSMSSKKIIYAQASRLKRSGPTSAIYYDIYEVDVATSEETRLTHMRFYEISSPYYLPGDNAFIFSAYGSPSRFEGVLENGGDAIQKKKDEHKLKWGNGDNIYVMQRAQKELPAPYISLKDGGRAPVISTNGALFFMSQAYKLDGSGEGTQCFEYLPDGKHRQVTNLNATTIWASAVSPNGELLGFVYDREPHRYVRKIVLYRTKDGTSKEITLPSHPSRVINSN